MAGLGHHGHADRDGLIQSYADEHAQRDPQRHAVRDPDLSDQPTLTRTVPPTLVNTATVYTTPTITPPVTVSTTRSATPTQTVTPFQSVTPPPAGTPVPEIEPWLDDLEDADLNAPHGGAWNGATDGGGSSMNLGAVSGCPYGTSSAALNCQGQCRSVFVPGWSAVGIGYPVPMDASLSAGRSRSLAFRVRANNAGLTLTVSVSSGATVYAATVHVDPGPWRDITIVAPDHGAPGELPQFSYVQGRSFVGPPPFHASTASPSPWCRRARIPSDFDFDFDLDDIAWGAYPQGASPSQLAAVFSVSLADVQEALSYNLSGRATWYLLVLARRCGCHPSEVLAHRATMSWGEIAALYGTTWAALVDEAWDLAEAAGIPPGEDGMDQILQDLRNGPRRAHVQAQRHPLRAHRADAPSACGRLLMKTLLNVLALGLLLPAPAAAQTFDMESGDLRRTNSAPSAPAWILPLEVQWMSDPCIYEPNTNPLVLPDAVILHDRSRVVALDRGDGRQLLEMAGLQHRLPVELPGLGRRPGPPLCQRLERHAHRAQTPPTASPFGTSTKARSATAAARRPRCTRTTRSSTRTAKGATSASMPTTSTSSGASASRAPNSAAPRLGMRTRSTWRGTAARSPASAGRTARSNGRSTPKRGDCFTGARDPGGPACLHGHLPRPGGLPPAQQRRPGLVLPDGQLRQRQPLALQRRALLHQRRPHRARAQRP